MFPFGKFGIFFDRKEHGTSVELRHVEDMIEDKMAPWATPIRWAPVAWCLLNHVHRAEVSLDLLAPIPHEEDTEDGIYSCRNT